MIQVRDGIKWDSIADLKGEEGRTPLNRSDFPELEFVTAEEIVVANKIRKEIKFFKAAALRYLHETGYLPIGKVERVVNDDRYRKNHPLMPELNWDYAAIRLLHLIQTKEFRIQDEDGIKRVKLADLEQDMQIFKTDFPEITNELEEMGIEADWGLNIARLMSLQEGNEIEILLQKAIIAQRCMKVVENIQIDYRKNRYK